MIEIVNKERCSGCSACANICSQKCITMEADAEGFLYPHIDDKKCISCDKCEKVCPIKAERYVDIDSLPKGYLSYEMDDLSRINSAAGGAFYAIAKAFIINYKGIVVGAAYSKEFKVEHILVNKVEDLQYLQKSKYVQSNVKDSFYQINELLKQDKYVLFSGTTCQVTGLKRMISVRLHEKLYCIDLSCYGVPSPTVFDKYLEFQKKAHGDIERVIMRDKKLYKNSFRVGYGMSFRDGTHYFAPHGEDPMARIFYSHIALRPICYECPFKTVSRISDITLGDCWYADEFIPNFKDKYGVTMILQHSDKGYQLIQQADSLKKLECDTEKLIKVNGGMIFRSSPKHPMREDFFVAFNDGMPFVELADKFAPVHRDGIKYKINLILKELGLLPFLLQAKKREKEIKRRCSQTINDSALRRYIYHDDE